MPYLGAEAPGDTGHCVSFDVINFPLDTCYVVHYDTHVHCSSVHYPDRCISAMESMEAAHVLTQSPDTGDRLARILTLLGSAYLVVRIGVDLLPA